MGYAQFFRCRPAGDFAPAPCGHDGLVILPPILELSSEVDASCFGGGDSLGLTLTVELSLCLSYIAQKLEYDISNQHPGEIPALAGIQQGHIQHDDGDLLLFRQ